MENIKNVTSFVGSEQEYFLIPEEYYEKRLDLKFTGRTLFGANPPKGQELDDHYYGSLKEKVSNYMKDLENELWKFGVPAKTKHNEAAPSQFEIACIYRPVNTTTDNNHLLMELMQDIAKKHGLTCLLHEKPFAGINGSGKHNNWSLTTDDGINLLDPGKKPHENTQFMLVLACVLKAVDKHAGLLRASAADVGNDHRLGAHEAPPAIISVYLGEQLEDILDQYIATGTATHSIKGKGLSTGVKTLPDFRKDAADRNRTSPFAFTGNKFEFRTVGSSMSIAEPNTFLNAMIAETLEGFADELEACEDFDKGVHDLIKKTLTEHQRVLFNGNAYSEEWLEEATRRGLPNITCFVDAIEVLNTPKAIKLFESQGIYSAAELHSRVEINYENYAKVVNIEAKTMIDMASRQYIPSIISYTKILADSINSVKAACPMADVSVQTELLMETSENLLLAKKAVKELSDELAKVMSISDAAERAKKMHTLVCPKMDALRAPIDKLETIVDSKIWPVPTYGELMFEE